MVCAEGREGKAKVRQSRLQKKRSAKERPKQKFHKQREPCPLFCSHLGLCISGAMGRPFRRRKECGRPGVSVGKVAVLGHLAHACPLVAEKCQRASGRTDFALQRCSLAFNRRGEPGDISYHMWDISLIVASVSCPGRWILASFASLVCSCSNSQRPHRRRVDRWTGGQRHVGSSSASRAGRPGGSAALDYLLAELQRTASPQHALGCRGGDPRCNIQRPATMTRA
jgi:hypothetical protein